MKKSELKQLIRAVIKESNFSYGTIGRAGTTFLTNKEEILSKISDGKYQILIGGEDRDGDWWSTGSYKISSDDLKKFSPEEIARADKQFDVEKKRQDDRDRADNKYKSLRGQYLSIIDWLFKNESENAKKLIKIYTDNPNNIPNTAKFVSAIKHGQSGLESAALGYETIIKSVVNIISLKNKSLGQRFLKLFGAETKFKNV